MNAHIATLQEQIRQIEQGRAAGCLTPTLSNHGGTRLDTGWSSINAAIGGGLAPGLHEWLGVAPASGESDDPETAHSRRQRRPPSWTPPICILAHLACQIARGRSFADWAVWIGRTCRPYGRSLVRPRPENHPLLKQSLFVAARDPQTRVWSVDLALRSSAVGLVIADASGWSMSDTQRIHLLAQQESRFALLTRPPREQSRLSAAQTRWLVRLHTDVQNRSRPRWRVDLLRCKGVRPVGDHRAWLLEWNRGPCTVDLSAPLADSASAPEDENARTATHFASRSA